MRGAWIALLLLLGGGCVVAPGVGPSVPVERRAPVESVAPDRPVVPEDLSGRIAGVLEGLLPGRDAPAEDRLVVVDAVRLTGSPVGGPVAAHLRSLMVEALSRYPERVSIVEEEDADAVLERLARWQGEAYDPTTAPAVGNGNESTIVRSLDERR